MRTPEIRPSHWHLLINDVIKDQNPQNSRSLHQRRWWRVHWRCGWSRVQRCNRLELANIRLHPRVRPVLRTQASARWARGNGRKAPVTMSDRMIGNVSGMDRPLYRVCLSARLPGPENATVCSPPVFPDGVETCAQSSHSSVCSPARRMRGWNKSCSQTHANAVRSKNVGRQTDRKTLQWLNTSRILVCKPSFRAEQRMENGHAPQSDVRDRGELSG
jgi:hypothetical protein